MRHDHDFLGDAHEDNARRTRWVVLLTAVMMVAEIAAGLATGSMALLADGIHMATHAGALAVAGAAYAFARANIGNPRYSFGTGKVGDLAGFASAIVLGLSSIGIAWESAERLFSPVPVRFGDAAVVAIIGLVVNLVSALLLSGGGHHHHDHDHGAGHGHAHGRDNNLRGAYIHVLADALTSVAAIVALLAGYYLGWVWLDPAIGIAGALVIARWSVSLMRDTAAVLLDTADETLVARVRQGLDDVPEATLTDLHVWRIGPAAHAAIVHVRGPRNACQAVRDRLDRLGLFAHLTVDMASD